MFVSSSVDGSIKIWDGVSHKCVNTFHKAHDGKEVCSVVFSRNSKVSVLVTEVAACREFCSVRAILEMFARSVAVLQNMKYRDVLTGLTKRPSKLSCTVLYLNYEKMVHFIQEANE